MHSNSYVTFELFWSSFGWFCKPLVILVVILNCLSFLCCIPMLTIKLVCFVFVFKYSEYECHKSISKCYRKSSWPSGSHYRTLLPLKVVWIFLTDCENVYHYIMSTSRTIGAFFAQHLKRCIFLSCLFSKQQYTAL